MVSSKEVDSYISACDGLRKERLGAIRKTIKSAVRGVEESMRYRMPTFEKNDKWVALANQKHYVSVYFCCEDLIADIRAKHPHLSMGKGCVRIRDTQDVPMRDITCAVKKALGK